MTMIQSAGISSAPGTASAQAAREEQKSDAFVRALDTAVKNQDQEKLYKACQDLESVFVNRVLAAMRASIPRSDLITRGMATETFESMLDEEYAKTISQQGTLGLADILYRQLSSLNK